MRSLRLAFLGLSVVFGMYSSYSQSATPAQIDEARNKGLKWLFEHQAGDGSWRSKPGTEVAATASAIHALNDAQLRGQPFARAVSWLANAEPGSVDSRARQIIALVAAGVKVTPYIAKLNAQRNRTERAVWGSYDHFGTSIPDTALSIGALRTGQNDTTGYLHINVRHAFYCEVIPAQSAPVSGKAAWPFTARQSTGAIPAHQTAGSIIPTVYALIELHFFKNSSGWTTANCSTASQLPSMGATVDSTYVQPAIDYGVAWLLDRQNTVTGGFGDAAPTTTTVMETALAFLALKTLMPANTQTARDAAVDYLLAQQNPTDGSWGNGDALLTALVLSVLPAPSTALIDTDGDGIPDAVETLMGKSTTVADSRPTPGAGTGGGIQGLSGYSTVSTTFSLLCSSSYQLPAPSGGLAPYSYAILSGALPSGLSLAASTGIISGMPSSVGTFSFAYTVSDAAGNLLSFPGRIEVNTANPSCFVPAILLLLNDD